MFISYNDHNGCLTVRDDIARFCIKKNHFELITTNNDVILCNSVSFGIQEPNIKNLLEGEVIDLL